MFYIMGTYFHSTLLKDLSKVLSWTKNTALFEADYLFIPIHTEPVDHWLLVVVDLGRRATIFVLDSLQEAQSYQQFDQFSRLRE